MDALKILVIFLFMLVLIFRFKRSLTVTFGLGCAAVAVAYRFDPVVAADLAVRSAFSRSTLAIIAIYYTVTFLQKMMESRGAIALAEGALLGLTNSRRISAEIAPMCVGLIPSPGAVVLGGAMVDSIYKDSVSNEDKNFVTSYFRHVPESFAPIYGSVVLACELANVPTGDFVLSMLPLVVLLVLLGHVMVMRRLPEGTGLPEKKDKVQDAKNLFLSLWPVTAIIIIVMLTNIDVYVVTICIIVLYFFVNRFAFDHIQPFFRSSFDANIIVSTVFILIFKDYIMNTDAVESLPRLFSSLPIPEYLTFSIIVFIGSVIVGSTAIIAIAIPLAYVTIPDGGTPLLVLLSSMAFAAMQVSISHICLFLSSAYFKVEVTSLIRRTVPIITVFSIVLVVYYALLTQGAALFTQ